MQSQEKQNSVATLTEIFPIMRSAIPPLSAYRLEVRNGDLATIGGKLSFRLQKAFAGHWIWSQPWIVTDTPQSEEQIKHVLHTLWSEYPNPFHGLLNMHCLPTWQRTAQVEADYIARGLWPDLNGEVNSKLWSYTQSFSTLFISRICDARGWVVQGEPALSLSIESRLVAKQNLQEYLWQQSSTDAARDLMVAARETTMKGIVTDICGTVSEHRGRLFQLASNEASKMHIQKAADTEAVVQVYATNRTFYDYVARSLQIVVRTSDYAKFGVNSKQVTKHLHLAPQQRSDMVKQLASLGKGKGLIDTAYSSSKNPTLFLKASSAGFVPDLLVGHGQQIGNVNEFKDQAIRTSLHRHGFYKRVIPEGTPILVGVLNALPNNDPKAFLSSLQREMHLMKFSSQLLPTHTISTLDRHGLDQAIHTLQTQGAHTLLALLPDETMLQVDETQWGAYDHFKSLAIGAAIPSQVVHQSTLASNWALGNVALGMLSKLGNIPYILSRPLSYADIVVGIDIARRRKAKLSGSMNATAITRIYQSTGEFLQYTIHDAQLEGETIPAEVLHTLFPSKLFRGKQVVIHRDGLYRGEEKSALQSWAKKLGATFHLVELLKSGTPRLYQYDKSQHIQQPLKGSAFKVNDYEAFLVSSLPPFESVTPYPLHIRCEAPLTIEQAIHSVLSMTLLHYGSLRAPRLPVTIHYSDTIAYLALKGIKPKTLEGTIPFWL